MSIEKISNIFNKILSMKFLFKSGKLKSSYKIALVKYLKIKHL